MVVHNRYSSSAEDFNVRVALPLEEAASTRGHVVFAPTPYPDTDKNIEAIAEKIRDGDIVLACGGDGTAHIAANATMHADGKHAAIGFLGFGNINDAAHTFSGKHHLKDPNIINVALDEISLAEIHPLEIRHNRNHWRYALLYATIGMTARMAIEFNQGDTRLDLMQRRNNLALNVLRSAGMYYKLRYEPKLPPYQLNEEPVSTSMDLAFMNGPRMAEILMSGKDYYQEDDYLRTHIEFPLKTVRASIIAGRLFLSKLVPLRGQERTHDLLEFSEVTTLPIQADGEPDMLEHTSELHVSKSVSQRSLRVIKPPA